eukprot:scaffold55_cov401-Prasinococcus_capsulatus_cf.AAC.9
MSSVEDTVADASGKVHAVVASASAPDENESLGLKTLPSEDDPELVGDDAGESTLLTGSTRRPDPEGYLALSDRLSVGQWKMFAFVSLNYFMNGMANLQQVLVEREPDIQCKAGQPGCDADHVCDFEWQYVEEVAATVAQTYDLVCSRSWMASLLGSLFFAGFGVGSVFGGVVADKYGRRFGLIVTLAIQCVGCLSFLASNSYVLYAYLRFVTGVGVGGQIVVGCTYLSEFMPPRWRAATCAAGINTVWSFGGITVASVAWISYSKGWNWQVVAGFAFFSSCLQFLWIFYVHETPHFLYNREDYTQSSMILRKIDPPTTTAQECTLDAVMDGPQISALDKQASRRLNQKVHGRNLRVILLLMMLAWLASSAAYYALALNTGSLPGSFYLNAIVNFLVDVPALILAIPIFDRFGRKFAVCGGLFGGGLCMVGMILGDFGDVDALLRSCAFLGKFFMQLSFGTVFVYTPELFPTALRSFGMGACSWAARLGGITAPFVLRGHELQGLFALTAVTLLAGTGVLTAVPETLNKLMPA